MPALHRRSFATETRLINLSIDGKSLKVPETATIMQACAMAGVDIPRFCYHERLGIAGNCRMCLVQVNDGPKLTVSCAAPVIPEMRIATASDAVKKGREGVMEFLLANHPLDCPICDQGGECDLQDQAMAFGSDRSRFQITQQNKRAVEDKQFGPLIKTSMNRCIHCTRCVRFANEVAGETSLGTAGRGNDMEIGTYIEKVALSSPLSGNLIDLCPVGALTSKPYAFVARPWELRHTDSIDVLDAVGANIKIDSRGMVVMRILPRLNEEINEEWLADKSRFAYDALKRQRLVQPLLRSANGEFIPLDWERALKMIAEQLTATPTNQIETIIGRFTDLETIHAAKQLLNMLGAPAPIIEGCNAWTAENNIPSSLLPELKFNSTILGVEEADAILFVGCDPYKEAPLLEGRIRKSWLRKDLHLARIGLPETNHTYDCEHLGSDVDALLSFSQSKFCLEKFNTAKNPMVIVGQDTLFNHPDSPSIMKHLLQLIRNNKDNILREDWNGFNVLPLTAAFTGAIMSGCRPVKPRFDSAKFIYLLNADDVAIQSLLKTGDRNADRFIVYQGHHGDAAAQVADLILPGAAYSEKEATFVNMEGRPQQTRAAVPPPGEARDDWAIIRALSEFVGLSLPFDHIDALRTRIGIRVDEIPQSKLRCIIDSLNEFIQHLPEHPRQSALPFSTSISDYYLTDCISRNSPTMAKCSLAFTHKTANDPTLLDRLDFERN